VVMFYKRFEGVAGVFVAWSAIELVVILMLR
jgi:hypothetical protein